MTVSSGWILAMLTLAPLLAAAQPDAEANASLKWRVQWANDGMLRSDDQFTNGFLVQEHSALVARLEDTSGTPVFGKRLAAAFLPDDAALRYRESWTFGQNMQTPGDKALSELSLNDVPYAAMLAWANTFVSMNDESFTGFEMLLGWAGPPALGEMTQSLIHEITGNVDPKGWDHELDNEPIVNFYYAKKRKLVRTPRFDMALSFDAALGNFFTFGQAALEMRFGHAPRGFAFVPNPIGRGMNYDALIQESGERFLYGSLTLRSTGFLIALQREGNNFTNSNPWTELNTIRMEEKVAQMILGVHIERPRWGVHLNFWLSSDTIEKSTLNDGTDVANSFGTIAVEWWR